jgi:CdiI immunity protein
MTESRTDESKSFDPADYPALRDFFPAYLHQDFAQEYGSPVAAVNAFLADASGDEILQLKDEWKAFRRNFWKQPFAKIQSALGALGSAWRPRNSAELDEFDEILSRTEA